MARKESVPSETSQGEDMVGGEIGDTQHSVVLATALACTLHCIE